MIEFHKIWVDQCESARGVKEEFEFMRMAGAFDEDPVRGAEDVLIVERIKEMLLE
jgi:hypothetical protein